MVSDSVPGAFRGISVLQKITRLAERARPARTGAWPMRAFLGIAAVCFGLSGIAAASAQSLSEAAGGGGLVIRTLKGDRVLAPQAEAAAAEAVDAAEEAQAGFAKASDVTAPLEAEETPMEAAEVATADAEAGTVHRIPLEE